MAAKHFMVAVILVQALSCSRANKRSFTTRPTPTKSDLCASNPCVHGQCQPYPSMNTYICKCIHGATGRNCEKETDMCLFNPCVFGTCSGHGINFTCTCDTGYTGKLCDKEIDMCLFNPCVFGTCSGHGLHYTCTCDKGWTGKLCNSQVQHINGGWTSWTTWSTCTLTCGTGTSSRSRSCTNPAPQNNGAQCPGSVTDTRSCNSNVCPLRCPDIDGYRACTAWVSLGVRLCQDVLYWECADPGAAHINGGWTSWTTWSTCTLTCGTGTSSRSRSCTNPAPQNNGAPCSGSVTDTQSCNSNVCPLQHINGGWTSWTTWSTCTLTCGTGTSSRSRSCTNPAPQNNGVQCSGSVTNVRSCNSNMCPIDGDWTSWTTWSTCSHTCGYAISSRTRSCTNPVPKNNGRQCYGPATDTASCSLDRCPVDGGWTQWTVWSHCSSTCGSGSRRRSRYCTNPTPRYHGATCLGHYIDMEKCNTNACHAKCDVDIIERHIREGTVAVHPDADICQGKHACSEALLLEACTLPSNDKRRWKPDLKVMDHCASLQRGEPVAEFIHGNYLEGMLNAVFWTCKGNYWEVAIQHLGYGVYGMNGTAPPFTAKWIYTLR